MHAENPVQNFTVVRSGSASDSVFLDGRETRSVHLSPFCLAAESGIVALQILLCPKVSQRQRIEGVRCVGQAGYGVQRESAKRLRL